MNRSFHYRITLDIYATEEMVADGFHPPRDLEKLGASGMMRILVRNMNAWPETQLADNITAQVTLQPSATRVRKVQGYT